MSSKHAGLYRCADDIANLQIRVRLKECSKNEDTDDVEEARTFQWQEKVYGKYERDFFKDLNNCITDLDKKYHSEVVNSVETNEKLFSYIDEDGYSIPNQNIVTSKSMSKLHSLIENLNINEEKYDLNDYDFINDLQNSIDNPLIEKNEEKMYIVADFGEYFDSTWLKNEQILVTLTYDSKKKVLRVFPDFNKYQPYELNISADSELIYYYYVENVSKDLSNDLLLKETAILGNVNAYKKKLNECDLNEFELPEKNILQVYLMIEILSAKNFEYDNIYVQYFIDLPNHWKCKDLKSLSGFTQACVTKGNEKQAFFGFPFEVYLEYDLRELSETAMLKPLYIYFEVVSKDSWHRYRIEGLSYKNLPITQPGIHNYNLSCFRITSKNPVQGMRRFFIGDYGSYNDISWVGLPQNHQSPVLNKFGVDTIGTGEIKVRINVLHQSQAFMNNLEKSEDGMSREKFLLEKLKSSKLIRSVEQVLLAFKRARKNMIEARKNI